jgi:indole-3-glycerol phosphate synthase
MMHDVRSSIWRGYYRSRTEGQPEPRRSFVEAIGQRPSQRNAIIAELKPISPSEGILLGGSKFINERLALYAGAGVTGLSVLTEPVHFGGSLENLGRASHLGLPVLMKDFVISLEQLDAASAHGASAVLLIATLFERGYASRGLSEMIRAAHERGLEVLLEVASRGAYQRALETEADMIGINNRDLRTLRVDLRRTIEILRAAPKDRLIWSLSGVRHAEDVRRLCAAGADAFLVGTSLMKASDLPAKLDELLYA